MGQNWVSAVTIIYVGIIIITIGLEIPPILTHSQMWKISEAVELDDEI